jgi:Na+-transporting methylmalonyl-CoA/oxaloacetate decarboxylase gamma subunit
MDAVTGTLFSESQHRSSTEYDIGLHEREIAQLKAQLEESERFKTRLHQQSLRWMGVYHLQNTYYKVDIARRDAVRDAIRHKSSTTHSFMVVSSILIGCLFAIIYQFQPPELVSDTGLTILMIFMGLALVILVASVRVSLSLQSTLGSYHVHRPLHHYKPCNKVHSGFNDFNTCHCESKEKWSSWLMLLGAMFTLASGAIYQYLILTEPKLELHVTTSATGTSTPPNASSSSETASTMITESPGIVFAVLCLFAICILLFGELFVSSQTHNGAHDFTGFLNKEQWVDRAREQYTAAAEAAEHDQKQDDQNHQQGRRRSGASSRGRLPSSSSSDDEDGLGGGRVHMNIQPPDETFTREPLY